MAATAAAADVLAGDCRQRMSVGCRDVYRLLTPSSSEEGSSIPDHRLTLNDSAAFPFDRKALVPAKFWCQQNPGTRKAPVPAKSWCQQNPGTRKFWCQQSSGASKVQSSPRSANLLYISPLDIPCSTEPEYPPRTAAH